MSSSAKFSRVQQLTVSSEESGQRLDNFLSRVLQRAPRALIYRIIRRGEVRVNSSRAKPTTRLKSGDQIRVPPVRISSSQDPVISQEMVDRVSQWLLMESESFVALNKPAGIAVHGGSQLPWGLIDLVRRWRPDGFLELVHRLDRGTSGCLLLAKNRDILAQAGRWFAGNAVQKTYLAVLNGRLAHERVSCHSPLSRVTGGGGQREVRVDPAGKPAVSHFEVLCTGETHSLVRVNIETGRTHQIRVHAASLGAPVAGDQKYGGRQRGSEDGVGVPATPRRLMLHCHRLDIEAGGLGIEAPLPDDFLAAADPLLATRHTQRDSSSPPPEDATRWRSLV